MASSAQPLGTVSYQYDAYGRRSRLTYPGSGLYVTYGYDDADELLRICENGANCTSTDVSLLGFTYDDYGHRTATKARKSDGTALSLGAYGFDSSLRLQTVTTSENTVTLGYSAADQINSRTNSSSSYEPTAPVSGATTYGVDGLNRMTTAGSSSLAYDLRGNMISDGSVSMGYNANNLLTSAGTVTLLYDAGGRLKSYTKGSVTYQFVYDGADLIAEYDGAGTLLRRYVHGPGDDEPLVWYEGTGTATPRFMIADERGSIIAVTNNAGTVLAQNSYDEYGVPYTTNATYAGRFRYTGQAWLPELSLYNYKARMYLPTIGRFLQTDPIGYGDGMNWYAYVHNDPMNGTDSSGLCDQNSTASDGTPIIVVCAGGQSGCDASCYRNMVDQWAINSYGDWAEMNAACNGNVTCEQYSFNRLEHYTDDTVTRPGLVTYLNVITLPAQLVDGVGDVKAVVFSAKKGIYWFKVSEKLYVGQSGNIARRLAQHLNSGLLKEGVNVQKMAVSGNRLEREIAEHMKIQEFTGGVPARYSDKVANKVDPIGPSRRYLLK